MKICIIGGGLTSLVLAQSLSKKGIDVHLIIKNEKTTKNTRRTLGISKENLDFIKIVEAAINSNHNPLIIFPQGTRCKTIDRPNFKKGVERIYKLRNIKCQPVVMNSGDIWPKHGNLHPNKNIIISVLTPIEPNLQNIDFLGMLQTKMYTELDKIL